MIRSKLLLGWQRSDKLCWRPSGHIPFTTAVLMACVLSGACSLHVDRLQLSPQSRASRDVYPAHVGVVVDKQFTPYKIKFRYWSTTPLSWALDGLPDAFVTTLRPYFLSVNPLQATRNTAARPDDLIARMSIDRLHFDGANTAVGDDTVDLTMTFIVAQSNGTEVFRTTLSASASAPYKQSCAFCTPDPREAYTNAFKAVFDQLAAALAVAKLAPSRQSSLRRIVPNAA